MLFKTLMDKVGTFREYVRTTMYLLYMVFFRAICWEYLGNKLLGCLETKHNVSSMNKHTHWGIKCSCVFSQTSAFFFNSDDFPHSNVRVGCSDLVCFCSDPSPMTDPWDWCIGSLHEWLFFQW